MMAASSVFDKKNYYEHSIKRIISFKATILATTCSENTALIILKQAHYIF